MNFCTLFLLFAVIAASARPVSATLTSAVPLFAVTNYPRVDGSTSSQPLGALAVNGIVPSAANIIARRYPLVTEVMQVSRVDLHNGSPAAVCAIGCPLPAASTSSPKAATSPSPTPTPYTNAAAFISK